MLDLALTRHRPLGAGGMGEVDKATNTRLNRTVPSGAARLLNIRKEKGRSDRLRPFCVSP